MTLLQDYTEYLEALRSWIGQGEKPLHEIDAILASIGSRFSEGDSNFLLYETPADTCLFTVRKRGEGLGIISKKQIGRAQAEELVKAVRDSGGLEWTDLCFFANEEGIIKYESYYDSFPVSDTSALTVGEVKASASIIAKELLIPEGGNLAIFAPTFSFGPIVYAIQSSGVNTIIIHGEMNENTGVYPVHPIPIELNTAFGSFIPEYGQMYFIFVSSKQDETESLVPGLPYKDIFPEGNGAHYCLRFLGDCFGNEILQIKGKDGQEKVKLFKEIQSF